VPAATRVEYRPLRAIGAPGSGEEELRRIIGKSSYDGLELAKTFGAALYADDLGLRRLLQPTGCGSFSTASLLRALAAKKLISADARDRQLLGLIARRHAFIPPTVDLLDSAIRLASGDRAMIVRAFRHLADSIPDLPRAVSLVIQLIRKSLFAPVRLVTSAEITLYALAALQTRWPIRAVVEQVRANARAALQLVPHELAQVERALTQSKGAPP